MSVSKFNNLLTKRNPSFEICRFLCAIGIVLLHILEISYPDNTYPVNLVYLNFCCVMYVQFFIFLMAFFCIKSKKMRFVNNALFFILFWIFGSIVASIVKACGSISFLNNVSYGEVWLFTDNSGFGGTSYIWAQWWYMFSILVFCLLMPFFNLLINNINKWGGLSVAIGLILFTYILSQIPNLPPFISGNDVCYSYPYINIENLLYIGGVYSFGAVWSLHFHHLFTTKKKLIISLTIIIVWIIVKNVMWACKWMNPYAIFFYADVQTNPLCSLTAWCLFLLFSCISIKNIKLIRFCNYLGEMSMIIYAIHYFVLFCFYQHLCDMQHVTISSTFVGNQWMGLQLKSFGLCLLIVIPFAALICHPAKKLIAFGTNKIDNGYQFIKNKIFKTTSSSN